MGYCSIQSPTCICNSHTISRGAENTHWTRHSNPVSIHCITALHWSNWANHRATAFVATLDQNTKWKDKRLIQKLQTKILSYNVWAIEASCIQKRIITELQLEPAIDPTLFLTLGSAPWNTLLQRCLSLLCIGCVLISCSVLTIRLIEHGVGLLRLTCLPKIAETDEKKSLLYKL